MFKFVRRHRSATPKATRLMRPGTSIRQAKRQVAKRRNQRRMAQKHHTHYGWR